MSGKTEESLIPDDFLIRVFARMDQVALGLAVGIVAGVVLFAATAILLLKGGALVGPNLNLIGEYVPWYSVSWTGSLVGSASGFIAGFAIGWAIAFLRNLLVASYVHAQALWARLDRFLDEL